MGVVVMTKAMVVMPVALLLIMLLINGTCAEKLIVGDGNGWDSSPSDGFYDQWAAQHNFAVGDILVFEFATGGHNVATVTSKEAYDKCDSSLDKNAVITKEGPYEVSLTNAGQYYYFCTIGSHCVDGQKFAATVSATPKPDSPPTPMSNEKDSSVGALITSNISAITAILMGLVLSLLY